jgi:hypothetical protein
MDFLIGGGDSRRQSGVKMTKRPRRNHTAAFKAKVVLAAVEADRTLAETIATGTYRALLLNGEISVARS